MIICEEILTRFLLVYYYIDYNFISEDLVILDYII